MYDAGKYQTARRAGCTAAQALAYARNARGCHLHGMWAKSSHDQRVARTLRLAALRQCCMSLPLGRTSWYLAYSLVREEAFEHRREWQRREVERCEEVEYLTGE